MKFLVVVDMQRDFINGSLGTPEAQAIVSKVAQKIENYDGTAIFVTQDTHQSNYLKTQEGKMLPIVHCVERTEGWQLHEDIVEALCRYGKKTFNFTKNTFACWALEEQLHIIANLYRIDEIVIVGLCTDICVVSNALLLKACFPETKIIVDAACCAGVTPESHESALKTMKMCQIYIENWEG